VLLVEQYDLLLSLLVHVHQSEGRRVIWISGYIFVDWSGKKTTTRFGFMVFNATFNNISAIS
jgi:hypothetical protein